MIGNPGAKDVALGITIRKYDDLLPEEKIFVQRFKAEIDTYASEVKDAIKAFKSSQRAAKQELEKEKNDNSGKGDFHEYLFGQGKYAGKGYIEKLRNIGMSAPQLLKYPAVVKAFTKIKTAVNTPGPLQATYLDNKPVALDKTLSKPEEKRSEKKNYFVAPWENATTRGLKNKTPNLKFDIALLTIHTDPGEAYVKVADGTRALYEKKGSAEIGGTTQYVKDDDGIFTRRYATMWKGKDVLKSLLDTESGYVKGKFATADGSKLPAVADPLAKDDNVFKVQDFEGKKSLPNKTTGATLNTREMLHVHQELGSGPSGRGLCLSSISLTQTEATGGGWQAKVKKSFANNGTAFSGADNLLVLVDLAAVPTDRDLLYNLYRPEAQERGVPVKISTQAGTFNDNAHMLNSVSKNRELFLRVLVPGFIVNWGDIQPQLS
jgi:hypothetical protein